MAPRRKAPRIEAPTTIDQATSMIVDYLDLAASVDRCKLDADDAIRSIEAARDEMVAPAEARMKDLFLQLRTWWSVARDDLTEGKRKSIELAGALLGDRIGTPALKLPKQLTRDEAVEALRELADIFKGAAAFLRIKTEIERQALIRLLDNVTAVGPMVEQLRTIGFRVERKEEFFITRAVVKEPDPIVEDAAAFAGEPAR